MSDATNMAATGGPGVISLGGQTYLVGQPDDRDFAAILAYLQSNAVNPIQAVAEDLKYLPPQYHAAAIKAAVEVKSSGGVEMSEAFTTRELMKPAGAAFLAWILIRKEQPGVTLEDVRKLVTQDNAIDVLNTLIKASGLEAVIAGKVGPVGLGSGGPPTGSPSTSASLKAVS